MRHNDVKRLADEIGKELQDAAEEAGRGVEYVEDMERYDHLDIWEEDVQGAVEELVAQLDLLADRCRVVLDEIAKAAVDTSARATLLPPKSSPVSLSVQEGQGET